jgi:group I intron endonuclease
MIGIYKITNPNNKIYIGKSINIEKRFIQYKNLHCKSQYKIYRSLFKYGVDNHKFEVIHECDIEELDKLEQYYIELFDTFDNEYGLNLTTGGDGAIPSQETREKRSISMKGKQNSLGMKHTEEWKRNHSAMMKGRKMQEHVRQQLIARNTGKKRSDEQKLKMSIAHKNLSEESRKNMSNAKLGSKDSEETRKKKSLAAKGRVVSKEQRLKISESVKRTKLLRKIERENATHQ